MLVPSILRFLHLTPVTRHLLPCVQLTDTAEKRFLGCPVACKDGLQGAEKSCSTIAAPLGLAHSFALPTKQFVEISITVSWKW